MQRVLSPTWKRKLYWQRKYLVPSGFVLLFAVVGVVLLLVSHAATPYASIEPESGVASGAVTTTTDGAASNNKYIQFGTAGSTTTPSSGGCTSGGIVAPCVGSATTGASGWGTPIFDDEFKNDSSLDTTKWEDDNCPFGTNICYDPSTSNVSFSGGYLNLLNNNGGTESVITTYPNNVSPGPGFQFTYGYAEARIWLPDPAKNGGKCENWPSFWLDNYNWPEDGEIDILECLDGGYAGYHFWYGPAGSNGYSEGNDTSSGYTGWHTFAADWEPGVITYYYDGVQVGQISQNVTSSPLFIILINGSSGDPSDPNSYFGGPLATSTMQVQYVRVWQK